MGYRYIGSKARIADEIIKYLGCPTPDSGRFIDAFSGTGIVACKAADCGWKIHANDMMHSAVIMSESQLLSHTDVPFKHFGSYNEAISKLNSLQGIPGFIWREYSPASQSEVGIERKYFTESNAKRIDGIVCQIYQWLNEGLIKQPEYAALMASLISATNNIANIAGTYGCFLSKWTEQSQKELLLEPIIIRKAAVDYTVSNLDVFDIVSSDNDVVYLDPPYTKRQYASYYHILETIVLGDSPRVSGTAGLRPWEDKASVFCYKTKALKALVDLSIRQKAKRVLISYSDDGHIQLDDLKNELSKFGEVSTIELASIGSYRPNVAASNRKSEVKEYLIDFRKFGGDLVERTANS